MGADHERFNRHWGTEHPAAPRPTGAAAGEARLGGGEESKFQQIDVPMARLEQYAGGECVVLAGSLGHAVSGAIHLLALSTVLVRHRYETRKRSQGNFLRDLAKLSGGLLLGHCAMLIQSEESLDASYRAIHGNANLCDWFLGRRLLDLTVGYLLRKRLLRLTEGVLGYRSGHYKPAWRQTFVSQFFVWIGVCLLAQVSLDWLALVLADPLTYVTSYCLSPFDRFGFKPFITLFLAPFALDSWQCLLTDDLLRADSMPLKIHTPGGSDDEALDAQEDAGPARWSRADYC